MSARYFREHVDGVIDAAGAGDLAWTPPVLGRVWHVTRMSAVDETSTVATSTRFAVTGHGYTHVLGGRTSALNKVVLTDTGEAMLADGDTLHALFVGGTAADAIHFYIEGWSELIEEFTGE